MPGERPTADDPETLTTECWRCGKQRYQYESCHRCGASCKPLTKRKQQKEAREPITDGGRDQLSVEVEQRYKKLAHIEKDAGEGFDVVLCVKDAETGELSEVSDAYRFPGRYVLMRDHEPLGGVRQVVEGLSVPVERVHPNSALFWLPATEAVADEYDVKVPKTEVIEIDFMQALPLLEGEEPAEFPHGELDRAACDLGWPVFIRTDLTSAKHDGLDAIQADNADAVADVARALLSASAKQMMRPAAFLVREWIDVDAKFTAKGGLPIGREFRLFATPDEHLCTHYYWPKESLWSDAPPDPIYHSGHDMMANTRLPPWMGAAARMAAFEAGFMNGIDEPEAAWSVDFARDEDGDWWLIDMALAGDSWHPECDQQEVLD